MCNRKANTLWAGFRVKPRANRPSLRHSAQLSPTLVDPNPVVRKAEMG